MTLLTDKFVYNPSVGQKFQMYVSASGRSNYIRIDDLRDNMLLQFRTSGSQVDFSDTNLLTRINPYVNGNYTNLISAIDKRTRQGDSDEPRVRTR